MTRTKVLLIAAFVVTLAAGVAVGLSVSRVQHRPHGPSWLAAELNLTDRQREQMHEIWSEAMSTAGRGRWEQHRAFVEERDQAILDLLTDEQRARYDAIQQEYENKREALDEQRQRAFEQAVERTKGILTPEQAAKYEELMKNRPHPGRGDRRGRGEHGPPPPRGGEPRPPKPPDAQENHPPTPPRGEE